MCTTVQLMEGGRVLGFCACVCGVDEILSLMFKHFSSIRQNVSYVRQTFQLGVKTFRAFVKHFSSALDETLGTFPSINLLMTSTSFTKPTRTTRTTRTTRMTRMTRTTRTIFRRFQANLSFKCFCILSIQLIACHF